MTNNKLYNLICFPYAGAGASMFNDWIKSSELFNIVAVELPGREKKFSVKPYKDVQTAINGLLPEIIESIDKDLPIVLFGHCLGSLLAYECAVSLLKARNIKVKHLIVSGSQGPWNRETRKEKELSDDDFIKNIVENTGYKHPALDIPAMRDLILPTLKADSEMNNSYCPSNEQPLDIPVTTVRGSNDILVSKEMIETWNSISTYSTSNIELEGGHMYITEQTKEILNIINSVL